jgi:hypothetical protein
MSNVTTSCGHLKRATQKGFGYAPVSSWCTRVRDIATPPREICESHSRVSQGGVIFTLVAGDPSNQAAGALVKYRKDVMVNGSPQE